METFYSKLAKKEKKREKSWKQPVGKSRLSVSVKQTEDELSGSNERGQWTATFKVL
jgi:hypothetical protein